MIYLTNKHNDKLSKGIKDLSPIQYESIQVKNKLLDGSYHIQTIGDPASYIEFVILSNHNQVATISQAQAIGEALKLIVDDKYYIGLLDDRPQWKRITMRYKDADNIYYTSPIRININEVGDI